VKYLGKFALLDERGQPLSSHIDSVLRDLAPRLQRDFPALSDEVTITEVLEEAGRKIVRQEQRSGPIQKLHGYAWVTVDSIATSRMRRGSMRLARATLVSEEGEAALEGLQSAVGTVEQIEADIYYRQICKQLTPEEQLLCTWKRWGFSSREIAEAQGHSVERVNTFFHRLKQKIHEAVQGRSVEAPEKVQRTKTRTA
jgi:DNA-directed RNA polymerase specialized sigma24 family protein